MGHAAIGLLLGTMVTFRERGRRGRDALGLTPALVLLLVLSANLPDLLHVGELRPLSHNVLVGPAMSVALALFVRRPAGLARGDMLAVSVASLGHVVGDSVFGAYHPLFPFDPDSEVNGLFSWNSPEDLATEAVLVVAVLAVLFHPRLAGRRLREAWPGRDHLLPRLSAWAILFILAANLSVFLGLNFVVGANRTVVGLVLFLEGVAMGWPFLRYALSAGVRPPSARIGLGGTAGEP